MRKKRLKNRTLKSVKHLLEYDDVLNQQRTVIYAYRRMILEGGDQLNKLMYDLIVAAVHSIIMRFCPNRSVQPDQAQAVISFMHTLTNLPQQEFQNRSINEQKRDIMQKDMVDFLLDQYELFRSRQNKDAMQDAEKWLMLETIDQAWKQHMYNLDHLKEGIGLRSWGQKNPLIEYKREAFDMFRDMMEHVRFDIIHSIFHLNVERFNRHELERKRERELEQLNMIGGDAPTSEPVERKSDKVGRNDPCPCGSGKKYKKCCGK